jgi:hypothetical protein
MIVICLLDIFSDTLKYNFFQNNVKYLMPIVLSNRYFPPK